jgi:hypothetical protein
VKRCLFKIVPGSDNFEDGAMMRLVPINSLEMLKKRILSLSHL